MTQRNILVPAILLASLAAGPARAMAVDAPLGGGSPARDGTPCIDSDGPPHDADPVVPDALRCAVRDGLRLPEPTADGDRADRPARMPMPDGDSPDEPAEPAAPPRRP